MEGDWVLIGVVAVAFIAGYSIVSLIVAKVKSPHGGSAPGAGHGLPPEYRDARFEKPPEDR